MRPRLYVRIVLLTLIAGGADIYSGGSLALNASGLLNEYSRIQSAGNMTLTIASGGITNRADAPTVQDSQSGLYWFANYQFRDGNWGSDSLNQWFSFNWLFLTDEYGVNHYLYLPGPFTGAYEALGYSMATIACHAKIHYSTVRKVIKGER